MEYTFYIVLQEEDWGNSSDRARLALEIIQHLRKCEENINNNDEQKNSNIMDTDTIEYIREFVQPTNAEEAEYYLQKLVLKRQYCLKPIFKPLLQTTRRERQHASPLRRLLAESNIDYEQLQVR